MSKTIKLPENFFGKEDRKKLESFGGHSIALGRATRWHWARDSDGDDVFEIFSGGSDEVLIARILRDREQDAFCAFDATQTLITSGSLEHVFAGLESHLARLHGEAPGHID
jgi:hypothetical protein